MTDELQPLCLGSDATTAGAAADASAAGTSSGFGGIKRIDIDTLISFLDRCLKVPLPQLTNRPSFSPTRVPPALLRILPPLPFLTHSPIRASEPAPGSSSSWWIVSCLHGGCENTVKRL